MARRGRAGSGVGDGVRGWPIGGRSPITLESAESLGCLFRLCVSCGEGQSEAEPERGGQLYAGSASGLKFLLYAMSQVS